MADSWFYVHNQQQIGPTAEAEMIELFRRGILGAATLVGQPGGSWQPASQSPLAYMVYKAQSAARLAEESASPAADRGPEWYYAKDQQQLGPLPEANIRHLIQQGQIGPDVYVGLAGGAWITIKDSPLASSLPVVPVQAHMNPATPTIDSGFIYKPGAPKSFSERQASAYGVYTPPSAPDRRAVAVKPVEDRKNINDTYAWLLAFLPFFGLFGRVGPAFIRPELQVGNSLVLRIVGGIMFATIFVVFLDKGAISRAGTKSPSFFLFLLPLVYLFQRARLLGKTILPAVVWMIGLAGFAFWPQIADFLQTYGLPVP